MKKKNILIVLLVLILSIGLIGCGSNETKDNSNKDSTTEEKSSVDLGMLKLTSSAPLFIAIEKGFFAEENIEVNVEWFDAAQPIAVATTGGSVDVGATGITASLYNMVAGGEDLLIVADKGREQKGYSSTALMVPKNSSIESIEDLKGKDIGITQTGSTFHYMAGRILEEHDLSTDDVNLIPLNSIPGLMETLESEKVDAVLLNEPNITRVVNDDYGKIIAQVGDEIEYQTSGLFFSKGFSENEDVAHRFLKAYIKATQYYYDAVLIKENDEIIPGENYDEVINIIAEYTDQEPDIIKEGLPYMDRNGELLSSDIQTQIDWYYKEGLIEQTIDANDIIKPDLLKKALEDLGDE